MSDTQTTLEEAKKVLAQLEQEDAQEALETGEKEQENTQEKGQAEEEFDADKAAASFDVTRTARQEALSQVENVLTKAASGRSIDKKELLKVIRALYVTTKMQDMLLVEFIPTLIRTVRSMAENEVQSFNTMAKLFTVTQALYKKGLVSEEEMEQYHKELTVPALMANLGVNQDDKATPEE